MVGDQTYLPDDQPAPVTATPHDLRAEAPAPTAHSRKKPGASHDQDLRAPSRGSIWIESIVVGIVGFCLMLCVYGNNAGLPGHDSFYHLRMATLQAERGLLHELPWLKFVYFTDEGHAFINHHYGFQLLLAPFIKAAQWWKGDELLGARVAMATFHGLSLLLLNLILHAFNVRWRWFWLVVYVLMPFQFFVRHAFVRAIGPSLCFMLLIVRCLIGKRIWLLALVVAFYVHLYLGAVLYAPLIVGLFFLVSMFCSAAERRFAARAAGWAALGWMLGILSHPYAGGIFEFLRLQVFGSGLSPDIPVGREWKSYEGVWWFARMAGVLLVAWTGAVCVRLRMGPPLNARELTLVVIQFFFLVMTFKARRFIEYWPPFCLLSAAVLAAPLPALLEVKLRDRFPRRAGRVLTGFNAAGAVLCVMLALSVARWSPVWGAIRKSTQCQYDLPAIAQAMRTLKTDSSPGDTLFTDDWDIFPVYFFYNTYNHYLVGLDPKFTQTRKPELWKRYVKISRGQVPSDVSVKITDANGETTNKKIHVTLEDIVTQFGARFVITDRDHKSLAAKLSQRDDLATLIYPGDSYEDERKKPYLIFRMKEAPPTPEDKRTAGEHD